MTYFNSKKLVNVLATTAFALIFLANPLVQAGEHFRSPQQNQPHPSHYFHKYPWLALMMDELTYGPITIWDVHLNKGSPLVVAKPGEIINGQLRYRVDSTNQEAFHTYHLVVGLQGIGAQDCVTHTWGVWDNSGRERFTLKAPLEPGVYEVRFVYHEAPTCEEARSVWNSEGGEPSSFATIGAIIVE